MDVTLKTSAGKDAGKVELPEEFFNVEPNISLLNQVVLAQLAAARQGSSKTKSRSEVSGGGAKPWRQKGTGRARAGSSRSPIWRGGGMTHALRPRDYSQKTPKKMVRAALLQSLSDRAREEKIVILQDWELQTPKTKDAIKILEALDVRTSNLKEKLPRLLVVVNHNEENVWKSLRGLSDQVQLVLPREINAYDILCNDYIVFSKDTFDAVLRILNGTHIATYDEKQDSITYENLIDSGIEALEDKEAGK